MSESPFEAILGADPIGERAAALFRRTWGGAPDGVWCAPGRVNLIGEHVDYARGICLPFALELVTACAARPREDGLIRVVSVPPDGAEQRAEVPAADVGPGRPAGWAGYVAGTAAGLAPGRGWDLALASEVPLGAGLSSSAALECAVGLAVAELTAGAAENATRERIRDAAIHAENVVVGAATGGLDQTAALFGKRGHAIAVDFHEGGHETVPADFPAAGLRLLVADTNAPHSLADGQYASRRGIIDLAQEALSERGMTVRDDGARDALAEWAAGPAAEERVRELLGGNPGCGAEALLTARMRHVLGEIDRTREAIADLRAGRYEDFGLRMVESHRSLRDDLEVVTPELDGAVEAALVAGALGARMTGGGFGGSIIALCPGAEVARIAEAILAMAARRGFPRPTVRLADPAAGARRLG